MTEHFRDKHALVTGGSRGIGRAIAARLSAAGVSVSIIGRDGSALERALKDKVAHQHAVADIADEAATRDAVQRLAADQPFDFVIANAGAAETGPFHRAERALFQRMLDINLLGTVTTFQATLPAMQANGQGRMIAISSTAGLRGYAFASAYSTAKHAIIGLVRSLALEYASTGITFNAICPGFTDTDLVRRGAAAIAAKHGLTAADAADRFAQDNPMKRLITPEEVADTVLWLCSDAARSVSGQAIAINGGEF